MSAKYAVQPILLILFLLFNPFVAQAALLPPSSLTATAVSSSQINLSWVDTNTTENGYQVERSLSPTSGFVLVGTTGSNGRTYQNTGLASARTYYYRVRATGRKGAVSTYSNVASATTSAAGDTVAPSVPTGLTASAVSCGQINLAWTGSTDTGGSGLKGYNVYRGGVFLKQVTTTSTSDSGLSASTSYSYRVAAVDNAGNVSAQSTATSATTSACADTTAPSVPIGLTVSAASCSQVNLSWTASTDTGGSGFRGYNVYRNGAFVKQVTIPSTSDTGLAASTTYSYRVAAVDNAGNVSAQSTAASATTPACADTTAPTVPTGLSATAVSCSQINLSWAASTDAGGSGLKGYNVYRNGAFVKQVTTTSTSDISLAASTAYSYTVAAVDNANNQSAQSTAASATTPACADTTAPSVPTGLAASAASCNQVNLAWTASTDTGGSGLKGYNVYRNGAFVKQVTTPSTSDSGLSASTAYSYTVMAVDNANNQSAQSNTAMTNTPACADTTAPSVPTGLTVSAVSCGQIDLSWNPSTDAGGSGLKGYNVYRGGVFLKQVTTTSISDPNLIPSTAYSYTVSSVDNANNQSAQSNNAMTNTPACTSGGGLVWDVAFGGLGSDIGQAVAVDSAGNIIMVGKFTGTVDFGGGLLTSAGGVDIFVAKYSAAGTHLWSESFGGLGSDMGQAVAVDSAGNVVVTGYFQGTVDFGGGPLTSAGGVDIFVAKYSAAGTHLWSKRFGGSGSDVGLAVAVDVSGNVVVTGPFQGTVDFGGGPLTSAGLSDLFVAKYSAAGIYLRSERFGGPAEDYGNAVTVDGTGNIVVTGYFSGTVNFGGGPLTSAGLSDVFVAKYSAAGLHLWSEGFGGSGYDAGNAVRVDGTGNIVVTGYFSGTVDVGGGPLTSAGGTDIFVAKYLAAGLHLWSESFGGSVDDYGYGITVDGSGDVVVTGAFQNTVDFGGGPLTSAGSYDIFTAKYSAAGPHLWSKRFGNLVSDKAYAVAADGGGNVVVTGFFLYQVDFGAGPLTSAGSGDIFLVKLEP